MVESFRESLRTWLAQTLSADVYVTAPGPGFGRPERRIDPALVEALVALPGVRAHGASRRIVVQAPGGEVGLDACDVAPGGERSFVLSQGDPATVWAGFRAGALVVSEPLAWRLQLQAGGTIELVTADGPRTFRIAGVYREYGNDRGSALIDLATYRALWRDGDVTSLGLYAAPGVAASTLVERVQAAAAGRQRIYVRANADIRELSMTIFERTFVITRVLYWLAAGVAAIGLVSALLAWELERSRDLAVLRSLGLTPRGAGLLIEAQTAFLGLAALVVAAPAGVLTAVVLVEVINRRAFGWQIDLHVTGAQFVDALWLALAAALAAGVYPAWRSARASIARDIREE
jgi:putative ABC transport system permease protein